MTSFVTQVSTDAHRNHQKSFEINIISKRLGLMTKHLMDDFVYQRSFIKYQTKRIYIDIDISVCVCVCVCVIFSHIPWNLFLIENFFIYLNYSAK